MKTVTQTLVERILGKDSFINWTPPLVLVLMLSLPTRVGQSLPDPKIQNKSSFQPQQPEPAALKQEVRQSSVGHQAINGTSGSSALDFGRNSAAIKSATRPLVEKWRGSIVSFDRAHRAATLGTIVTAEGLVIAKLSELELPLNCVLSDGRKLTGNLVATDRQLDLALIKIEAKDLIPIELDPQAGLPTPGDFLISVDQGGDIIGIGVVSTGLNQLPIQQQPGLGRVRMGINISEAVESKTVLVEGKYLQKLGLRIQRVEPRSVGEAANLIVDDLICSVDGKPVSSLTSWNAAMQSVSVGRRKSFEIIRNDKLLVTSAETLSDSQRTIHDLWGGGPFSERRFEFGQVIIHDTKIRPEICGAPLFDLEGNCVGINIARSLRVASFAIPSGRIREWIQAVQPNSNLIQEKP